MSKYVFRLLGSDIECKEIIERKDLRYVTDYSEFKQIIFDILNSNYVIKVNETDMSLKTKTSIYVFRNYKVLLTHPEFKLLLNSIKRNIENGNYIDTTQSSSLNTSPHRKSKHNGRSVIRVSLFTLTLLLAINPFLSKILGNVKETTNEDIALPSSQEMILEEDKTEQPFEIEDKVIVMEDSLVMNSAKPESNGSEIDTVTLDFEELSNTDKAEFAQENFYELLEKYSKDFGLDAKLMLGIATEERGTHSREIDSGGGVGLMQVQYDVWIGHDLIYYRLNPETGEFEKKSVKVTDERMRNLETNIETGCMIFQECLRNSKYNIPVAIQMYNMGYGTMQKILGSYAEEKGVTIDDILKDPTDIGWIKYREGYAGDPEYLEKVNMWVLDNTFTVTNVFTNEEVSFAFTNANEQNYQSNLSF